MIRRGIKCYYFSKTRKIVGKICIVIDMFVNIYTCETQRIDESA